MRLGNGLRLRCNVGETDQEYQTPNEEPTRIGSVPRAQTIPQIIDRGSYLSDQYARSGDSRFLDEAISLLEGVVSVPESLEAQSALHGQLGALLHQRYAHSNRKGDLYRAIDQTAHAITAAKDNKAQQGIWESNLGDMLLSRFYRSGSLDDLNLAIVSCEKGAALALICKNEDHLCKALNNHANGLAARYHMEGQIEDLQHAIELLQRATVLEPKMPNSTWASRASNLGRLLALRYERTGCMEDLHCALATTELALGKMPETHVRRAITLNAYALLLQLQFRRTKDLDTLNRAIQHSSVVITITPPGRPDYKSWALNYANMLLLRYEWTNDLPDIVEAAEYLNAAEGSLLLDTNHENDRFAVSNSLGKVWLEAYLVTANQWFLDEAERVLEDAIRLPYLEHLDQAIGAVGLAGVLYQRYQITKQEVDLGDCITAWRYAVSRYPRDHPDRSMPLVDLAYRLVDASFVWKRPQLLEAALEGFRNSYNTPGASRTVRIRAARGAVRILTSFGQIADARQLATGAVGLLPEACTRVSTPEDQQRILREASGLAAEACSLSILDGIPHEAVLQLETGRAIILGHLLDSHPDLTVLRRCNPDLSRKFEDIQAKVPLLSVDGVPIGEKPRHPQPHATWPADDLESCLSQIRQVPGCEHFLLPLTFDELRETSKNGPIVMVNATYLGCHALILDDSQLIIVHLSKMEREKGSWSMIVPEQAGYKRNLREPLRGQENRQPVAEYYPDEEKSPNNPFSIAIHKAAKCDRHLLAWLWETCVKPVFDAMAERASDRSRDIHNLPRVWWIGSGSAVPLPFHAATCRSCKDSTMHRAVPSYTPSIRMLRASRLAAAASDDDDDAKKQQTRLSVAAMPTTPGEDDLPGVRAEISEIFEQIIMQKNGSGVLFSAPTVRVGPTAREVLDMMWNSDIVHIACHGSSDPMNPLMSCLLLQRLISDGHGNNGRLVVDNLTVSEIAAEMRRGSPAKLVFLSACSAAEVKVESLADEDLHIASVLQAVGFPNVIGSLWSVKDAVCIRLSRLFYHALAKKSHGTGLDSNSYGVAHALRDAVMTLRLENTDPKAWAVYINLGA